VFVDEANRRRSDRGGTAACPGWGAARDEVPVRRWACAPAITPTAPLVLTIIENGDVYDPAPRGRQSVLLVDSKIGAVGAVDRRAASAWGSRSR
jgi:hypothetical protein